MRDAETAWVSQEGFVFIESELKDNCLTLASGSYYADDETRLLILTSE